MVHVRIQLQRYAKQFYDFVLLLAEFIPLQSWHHQTSNLMCVMFAYCGFYV